MTSFVLLLVLLCISAGAITQEQNSVLPSATMSMKDLVPLLNALEIGQYCHDRVLYIFSLSHSVPNCGSTGLPFSFAHFNDGEITALHCREGRSTSKKKQPCSVALQNAMHQVLSQLTITEPFLTHSF